MTPVLGVALMDRDHAALDRMLVEAREKPESELLHAFDAVAKEIRDHFAREEEAMTEARVPILLCHLELHAQILREVERMRSEIASRGAAARDLLDAVLPEMIGNHVASADTVTARFLRA